MVTKQLSTSVPQKINFSRTAWSENGNYELNVLLDVRNNSDFDCVPYLNETAQYINEDIDPTSFHINCNKEDKTFSYWFDPIIMDKQVTDKYNIRVHVKHTEQLQAISGGDIKKTVENINNNHVDFSVVADKDKDYLEFRFVLNKSPTILEQVKLPLTSTDSVMIKNNQVTSDKNPFSYLSYHYDFEIINPDKISQYQVYWEQQYTGFF